MNRHHLTFLIVFCLIAGMSPSPFAQPTLPVGLVPTNPGQTDYPLNDPIALILTLENPGGGIITSRGFMNSPFWLDLVLIDPNGRTILANKRQSAPAQSDLPPPPESLNVGGTFFQGERIETVPAGWNLRIPFNLRDHYQLPKGGRYCVRAQIPMKIFSKSTSYNNALYGLEDDVLKDWPGVFESKPFCFNYLKPVLADLELAMTGPASSPFREPLTYNLLITNKGPDTAENIKITDTLPAQATFFSITPDYYPCAGTNPVCNSGNLLPGKSKTVTIQLEPTGTGTLVNSVAVSSDATDEVPGNDSATVSTLVAVGQPRIAGSIAAKGRVGEIYYVDLKLTNSGTGIANNVQLNSLIFKVLSGTGSVTLHSSASSLPLISHIGVNQAVTLKLPLNVTSGVTRFQITESGKVQDVNGKLFSFSIAQAVIP